MNPMIQRAVVTGAAGFIGRALVTGLRAIGTEVVATDMVTGGDASIRMIDVTSPGALDSLLKRDTILFHLASPANVPGSVADPMGDFRVTLGGTLEALESARRTKSRFIFPSTASIFDPNNPQPVTETAWVRPTSPYSAAKASSEAYCSAYHKSFGLDTRVIRLFSVYGIGMRRFAIHDIIRKIQKNPDEIVLLGDGTQFRDYLYIDDVVRGMIHVATHGEPGEDYNIGSGTPVMIVDLARRIGELMGRPNIRISTTGQSFPGDVARWYGDVSKARRIGFEPAVALDEGLRRTIASLAFAAVK